MRKNIALVDDDRNILTSVSMTLEQEGFAVRTYTDGESALQGITARPVDLAVLDDLSGAPVWGEAPDGTWATTRIGALDRLHHFIDNVLPQFGPHEDAMTSASWHVAHSLLAHYLNVGLLHPMEVVRAAEAAYRRGEVPIASAEGFIRQVIGWREYVWGLYWFWGQDYGESNELNAHRPLPPVFKGRPTQMRCVAHTLQGVHDRAWVHHIERLMILGNFLLLCEVHPDAVYRWFMEFFIDAYDWVMVPNVYGMALHADGGLVTTKPYVGGSNYLLKMGDFKRGDWCADWDALFWTFIAEHRDFFDRNPRLGMMVRQLEKMDGEKHAGLAGRARAVLARLES